MSDHTAITDSQLDAGSPVDETLMFALRDNPKATFENDPTAVADGVVPHGMWTPDPNTTYSDGLVWDYDVDGAASIITAPDFDDGYDYRFVFVDVSNTTAGNLEIEAQRVSDSSWDTFNDLTNGQSMSLDLKIMSPTVTKLNTLCSYFYRAGASASNSNAVAGESGAFAFRGGGDAYSTMRFDMSAGNFDGGKIYMYRSKSLTP